MSKLEKRIWQAKREFMLAEGDTKKLRILLEINEMELQLILRKFDKVSDRNAQIDKKNRNKQYR